MREQKPSCDLYQSYVVPYLLLRLLLSQGYMDLWSFLKVKDFLKQVCIT